MVASADADDPLFPARGLCHEPSDAAEIETAGRFLRGFRYVQNSHNLANWPYRILPDEPPPHSCGDRAPFEPDLFFSEEQRCQPSDRFIKGPPKYPEEDQDAAARKNRQADRKVLADFFSSQEEEGYERCQAREE
ncbi:MAG TPA: hypothetical protein VGI99_10870 [Gemmataceae bacterium]